MYCWSCWLLAPPPSCRLSQQGKRRAHEGDPTLQVSPADQLVFHRASNAALYGSSTHCSLSGCALKACRTRFDSAGIPHVAAGHTCPVWSGENVLCQVLVVVVERPRKHGCSNCSGHQRSVYLLVSFHCLVHDQSRIPRASFLGNMCHAHHFRAPRPLFGKPRQGTDIAGASTLTCFDYSLSLDVPLLTMLVQP